MSPPVKLWALEDKNEKHYDEMIRETFGKTKIAYIKVLNTSCSILMLDGDIYPLILDSSGWQVWEIKGLGKDFSKARSINVKEAKVVIRGVEGCADIDFIWILDFSQPDKGFSVNYEEEGGWY